VFECHAQAGPQGSFEKPRFKGVGAQWPYPQQTIRRDQPGRHSGSASFVV